ncbi:MAG: GNAT family N-acetyltransferase [Streptosporangiales bacterium]
MTTPVVLSPAPRDRWRAALVGGHGALPEHTPEWVDALCATGRYRDASRLYVLAEGREVVLPMVERRGLVGAGGWLQSYPAGWGMGGLVGSDVDVAVARAVLRDLRGLDRQRIGIRPDPLAWPVWAKAAAAEDVIVVPRRAHVVDLHAGVDAAWSGLSKSARRGTRVAERAGIRVEVDRSGELIDDYYRLFLLSLDRWAENQHEPRVLAHARARRRDPLAHLHAMSEALGKSFAVTLAYLEGVPVFGAITLFGQTAHDTRAAMDRARVGTTRAGDLVQWTTMQLACDLGCTAYHLGESGQSSTLAAAKEKYGARPYDYGELRVERLPWTRTDTAVRTGVKRLLGFRDV